MNLPLATETWDSAEYGALQRVIASGRFTMGPEVRAFEEQFAAFFGAKHAVMVNSGSSANLAMLAALRYHPAGYLPEGSEIIVPAVSWSTTFFPIHQCGMTLRFVEIDPETLNLDPAALAGALTSRTKAVLAVNLLGNPCQLDQIKAFCDENGLILVEDNCESMGARLHGRFAGAWGICGSFSTFFSHHISTMEGGVVITDDTKLYHIMLSLRSHGWVREQPADSHLRVDVDEFMRLFRFVLPGYNIRPLEMSGALGQEQLRKLPRLIAARRANAITFKELFEDHPDVAIQRETGESSWFGFAFTLRGALAGRRLELVEALRGADIETRPIVSGNFLNNPAVEYLQYSVSGEMRAAQRIDEDGLFIGNHHFAVSDALARCREIVDAVGARGPAWNRNMSRPNRLPAAVVGSPLRERAVA